MTKEQRFDSVTDFLELDEQTFQRMLPDLVEWHRSMRETIATIKGLSHISEQAKVTVDGFVWVDDGKSGNNLGARIVLKGKRDHCNAKV